MKNLAQKRAKHALDKVNEIIDIRANLNNKNFKSFAAGAPTIILQHGLGQALAFWASKMKSDRINNEKYILYVIKSWFANSENPLNFIVTRTDEKSFITSLLDKDQAK
jgi:CRISPR-associated protein Cmr5